MSSAGSSCVGQEELHNALQQTLSIGLFLDSLYFILFYFVLFYFISFHFIFCG